jgi:hypothetical protein
MKEGMEEVRNARKMRLEHEELKKKQGFAGNVSRTHERDEIERLQGIIAQLQANSGSRINSRVAKKGEGDSNYELEFNLHQAETRIASLEQELQEKAKSYARELAMLRMKVAEKEAVMDGYRS